MKKYKISLIKLGHVGHLFKLNTIKNWNSDIFEISNIQSIERLPETEVEDYYLDQKFDVDQLSNLIICPDDSDIAVGVMAYRFIDNFYMHRIGKNCVIISLYGISDILTRENISMENFILKQLYEISAFKCLFVDISTDEVYSIVHGDTRGCIFDLNGDRQDIIYNTEKPKICDSCKNEFRTRQIDSNIISKLEKELKRVKKPITQRIEKFVRKYPLLSMIVTGLIAITLNLIATGLWDFIK